MIAALVVCQALTAGFSPPLVFFGEPFRVSADPDLDASYSFRVKLRKGPAGFFGRATGRGAKFWLVRSENGGVVDAAEILVPLATVPRWSEYPEWSGAHGRIAFLAKGEERLAAVPMDGNYGLCYFDGKTERRWAHIFRLDVAVRSGPRHTRGFVPDFMYGGLDTIHLQAFPDKVARVDMRIAFARIDVIIVAEYEMQGDAIVLGERSPLRLRKGGVARYSAAF